MYKQRNAASVAEFVKGKIGRREIEWDPEPWLLGTANGVVDLRTGELRPAEPRDLVRSHTSTPLLDLDAEPQRFIQFLNEIFEDKPQREELIGFLQRVLGMGLVGAQPSAAILIAYGPEGRNGKDTLAKVIRRVLGSDVSGEVSKGAIEMAKNRDPDAPAPGLMGLRGKRIAWVTEPKEQMVLDGALVKYITGGNTVTARNLNENNVTFKATWLPIVLTNFKPRVDNVEDEALWERILMISFGMRFVEDPTEPNERKAIPELDTQLKDEDTAILAWLVRGCLEYQRVGLAVPQFVRNEIQQYRSEEDHVLRFIEQRCVVDADARIKHSELEAEYHRWCEAQRIKPLTERMLPKSLKAKGFDTKKSNGVTWRLGLHLAEAIYQGNSYAWDFSKKAR
jgi:putative DNA primase/helicase